MPFALLTWVGPCNHEGEGQFWGCPPQEDRATAIGSMHKKLVKIGQTHRHTERDRQTDRHARHNTTRFPLGAE